MPKTTWHGDLRRPCLRSSRGLNREVEDRLRRLAPRWWNRGRRQEAWFGTVHGRDPHGHRRRCGGRVGMVFGRSALGASVRPCWPDRCRAGIGDVLRGHRHGRSTPVAGGAGVAAGRCHTRTHLRSKVASSGVADVTGPGRLPPTARLAKRYMVSVGTDRVVANVT